MKIIKTCMYDDDDDDSPNKQCLIEIEHIDEANENRITFYFFMVICANLFNPLKGNSQLTKYVLDKF